MDNDSALKDFYARREANVGKQIDNASLPAGSSMHYYCRFCGEKTETLPELHLRRPKLICDACKALYDQGLLTPEVLSAKK